MLRWRLRSAALPAAIALVSPRLWLLRPGADAAPLAVPLADVLLDPTALLVADSGSELTTWLGAALAADEAASASARVAAAAFMTTQAWGRFPVPLQRVVTEGSSGARYLLARLAPMHKDAQAVAEAQHPVLRRLRAEAEAAGGAVPQWGGVGRFLPTEELSFLEWLAQNSLALPLAGQT